MVSALLPFSIFFSTVLSPLFQQGCDVKFNHYKGSTDKRYDYVLDYYTDHDYHDFFFDPLNSTYPTVMYTHGFLGDKSVGRQFCTATYKQYQGKVNCIIVDWAIVSHHMNYVKVKNEVKQVSKNYEFSIFGPFFMLAYSISRLPRLWATFCKI